ncbi:MAG: hypothetical protein J0J01_01475 [Reyranella sp.]|uniref:hypothetical protein n=1 Tax=Reyranella sp. TaxID=1929291 RepID=UPI001AC019F2|nr:hypothetical protein [Reyranella sp.]MBN9085551.1 hypothetical protein [Reyranella sp.]
MLDRAAPELRTKATPEQLALVFDTLAKLGPMVAYEGAKGDATMSYGTGAGAEVSARYVATARFQNGNATFQIVLIKRDGSWTILSFHADPVPAGGTAKRI